MRNLLSVPFEEIEALNECTATICYNCEKIVTNLSHYQSKADSLKKMKLSSLMASSTSSSDSSNEDHLNQRDHI